jgi:hypothetical protein
VPAVRTESDDLRVERTQATRRKRYCGSESTVGEGGRDIGRACQVIGDDAVAADVPPGLEGGGLPSGLGLDWLGDLQSL